MDIHLQWKIFTLSEMSNKRAATGGLMTPPDTYEIRIQGLLNNRWSNWFEGLTITQGANDETILKGELKDQADLHGILMKIRDLHLVLISVNRT
jgi:hypothetical protein